VENLLDIPIDYYVKVNMEGFEDIVDAIGGVTIYNEFPFDSGGYSFPKGTLTLDGEQALAYSRMRHEDPNGDFGRQERQRKMIQSVLKEGASLSSLWNYGNIFNALGNNVKTNLTFEQLIQIQNDYRSAITTVQQTSLDGGYGDYINNIYYYIVPEEQINSTQQMLKNELGL